MLDRVKSDAPAIKLWVRSKTNAATSCPWLWDTVLATAPNPRSPTVVFRMPGSLPNGVVTGGGRGAHLGPAIEACAGISEIYRYSVCLDTLK